MDAEKLKAFKAAMAAGREAYRKNRKMNMVAMMIPCFVIGTVDLVRAYQKNDREEVIFACVIFFVIGPLIAWGWNQWRYRHTS
jgi:ACR3 family arsenite efflux pump ArsB